MSSSGAFLWLEILGAIAAATGDDPELDTLLLRLRTETAGGPHPRQASVQASIVAGATDALLGDREQYQRFREQP